MDAGRYDVAIADYSTALSLGSSPPQSILIKRSKACVATGSWTQALDDANRVRLFLPRRSILLTYDYQVIALDPLSP